jgi:uncharacterized protein YjdB
MVFKHSLESIKRYFSFAILLYFTFFRFNYANAQFAIDGVSYQLKYNSDSCHYEVLLIVNQGSTTAVNQRIAFSSQISLRYKSSLTTPTIKRNYFPVGIATNQPLSNQWTLRNQVVNPVDPGFSYIGFLPTLDGDGSPFIYKGSGAGGNIVTGDTIKLFSLNGGLSNCDLRLYINGSDPGSNAPGMNGSSFSNGFVIESPLNQVYQNNAAQILPLKPLISSLTTSCSNGISIDLSASGALTSNGVPNNCQGQLTYAWSGPAGFKTATQDVNLPTATSVNRGQYKVTVTDNLGCTVTDSIIAENKPFAGRDTTICGGNALSTLTLIGTEPANGTWSPLNNYGAFNPGATANGAAQVNFATFTNSNPAIYTYIYTTGSPLPICFDTIRVTVNPRPAVGLVGSPFICAYIDNNTKQLSPAVGGTWVSNNPSVASISGNLVTGVSPGLATFTFTNNTTGCNNTTTNLRVDPKPSVAIGNDSICLNSTTILTPSINGSWSLSNPAIATLGNFVSVNNEGTFYGLRADAVGSTKLWYRVNQASQASCISDTLNFTVVPGVSTNLITPNLCSGNNGSIVPVPNTVGTWESTNPTVAVINNSGVISAVSPGQAQFIFTQSSTGCKSVPSNALTVTNPPTILGLPTNPVAAGTINVATLTVIPNLQGTWISNNPSVATINPSGVINTLSQGLVNFTFNSSDGCSSISNSLIVIPRTALFADQNNLCIGTSTRITSGAVTGTWIRLVMSSNIISYTASPTPTVIALSPGIGYMEFTASNGVKDTLAITVVPKPAVSLLGQDSLCIGQTTNFSPSTGGFWESSNNTVATINQSSGIVTAINGGTATFKFRTLEGCESDPSIPITVIPNSNLTITDPSLCIGETSFLESDQPGGTWIISNPAVASIDGSGVVTANAAGFTQVRYREPLLGCIILSPTNIVVNSKPSLTTSNNNICGSETAMVSASPSAGAWSSNNNSIATVSSTGLVTPGLTSGIVRVTFTALGSGCQNTIEITVRPQPIISNFTKAQICIGDTTSLVGTPNGGSWTVEPNNGIATISSSGIITGIFQGTTAFRYSQAGCQSDLSTPLIVINGPTINPYTRPEICLNDTLQLTANGNGIWSSQDTSIATINPTTGVVTGKKEGSVFFRLTSGSQNCASQTPTRLNVKQLGVATINTPSICVGATAFALPSTGGAWFSSDPSVAVILNNGTIVGQKAGTATFIWQSASTGCRTQPSGQLIVTNGPTLNPPADNVLCIGEVTTISATGNPTGSWNSENPSIASISSAGLITALNPGTTRFQFRDALGCASDFSVSVFVRPRPFITINGPDNICVGGTSDFNANANGIWTSLNPTVASINSVSGNITGLASGTARFLFTSEDGCPSDTSIVISVSVSSIRASIIGRTTICSGDTSHLAPSSGGIWSSSNPQIATVTNEGLVTGIGSGIVTFTFAASGPGCVSSSTTGNLLVNTTPIIFGFPSTFVSTGIVNFDTLVVNKSGSWQSSNPSVATISPNGAITTISPGIVNFTFTSSNGCIVTSPNLIVEPRTGLLSNENADINFTYINKSVTGDVSSNDKIRFVSYGPIFSPTIKTPGSNPSLTLLSNGTYTFVTDLPGLYIYDLPGCLDLAGTNCRNSLLTIQVLEPANSNKTPIATNDFGWTRKNRPIAMNTLANDACAYTTGCSLNNSVVIVGNPTDGLSAVGAGGIINYIPNNNFVGKDTLTYRVCVTGEPSNCTIARQIITVEDSLVINSTYADDDFIVVAENIITSGNVKNNDSDPQGNIQTVTAQTIMKQGCTLILNSDGSFTFTPSPLFTGPISFSYRTCDNGTPVACDTATLYITVVPDFYLKARVYLEGSIIQENSQPGSLEFAENRPLMRDNLRNSPFTGLNYIPIKSIYKYTHDNNVLNSIYDIRSKFQHVGAGLMSKYDSVSSPTVFSVSGQDAIVDWIFVELRALDTKTVLASRAGLLQRDGDIVEVDGRTNMKFPGLPYSNYFVVIRHRNHLGIMSKNAQTPTEMSTLVDFTKATFSTYDKGIYPPLSPNTTSFDFKGMAQIPVEGLPQFNAMWAGDFDANGKVKFDSPDDDLSNLLFDALYFKDNIEGNANYDFAISYTATDFDMNSKSKFDNPDDDRNLLYGQIILYKLNTAFSANFDFLIEQLPD